MKVPPSWTNSELLAEAERRDEVAEHFARIKRDFAEAMSRYIEAVHRNAPLTVKERLWAEVVKP